MLGFVFKGPQQYMVQTNHTHIVDNWDCDRYDGNGDNDDDENDGYQSDTTMAMIVIILMVVIQIYKFVRQN